IVEQDRFSSLGHEKHVGGMSVTNWSKFVVRLKPFQSELAHRLQHCVARFQVRSVNLAQQAMLDQGGNAVEDTGPVLSNGGDCLRRGHVEATNEDAQPTKQGLHCWR